MTAQPDETAKPDRVPGPAIECRRLLRRSVTASLATAERDRDKWPYASLVQVACAHDGSPVLLLSDLADHTKNFTAENRVSMLFDDARHLANPLTGARITVQGRVAALGESGDDTRLKARYLARHPEAADYAAFADFRFYRVTAERLHLVAGFGRIHWLPAADVMLTDAATGALATAEDGILDHMNADHADAIDLYARSVHPYAPGGWRMTGIDPDGIDLMRDGSRCRVDFAEPVRDGESARRALVGLVNECRAAQGLQRKG